MPTPTYDLIASNVLGSSATSVTFSAISGSYRDLVLVFDGSFTSSGAFYIRVNSDSGSNYFAVRMSGDGSTTESASFASSSAGIIGNAGSTTRVMAQLQLLDYSSTDKHKSYLSRSSDSATRVAAFAGRWASTSAITSIQIGSFFFGNFQTGSSFYLYGIVS
jgi:hypothetical protein